jgi:hypothetical protein
MFCSPIEAIAGLGDCYAPAVRLVQEQRRIGYRAPRYLRVQRLEGMGGAKLHGKDYEIAIH